MYKLIISYDGRNFFGFQRQLQERTVQSEIEKTLQALFQENTGIQGSGRTDRGVHALAQVISFKLSNPIPAEKLLYVLNRQLPKDIKVLSVDVVPDDFHPRFSARKKTYCYRIKKKDDVFERPYAWIINKELDLSAMREAAAYFIGQHDFFSFSNRRKGEDSTIRTMESILIRTQGEDIFIELTADGFLYKMVRILVHHLVRVGLHQIAPGLTEELLLKHDRTHTRHVAPAEGLYLKEVCYEDHPPK